VIGARACDTMNYLRRIAGFGETPPQPQPPAAAAAAGASGSREKLLRAQRLRLAQLEAENTELQAQIRDAAARGDKRATTTLVNKQRLLGIRVTQCRGQLDNMLEHDRTLQAASANVQQATLMKSGAEQLTSMVTEAEQIDIDGVIDQLQDGASLTHEMSNRLAEPIYASGASAYGDLDEPDVDEQVERLMQQAADEKAVQMRTDPLQPPPPAAAVAVAAEPAQPPAPAPAASRPGEQSKEQI